MVHLHVGNMLLEISSDTAVPELSYLLLRPLLDNRFKTESVLHLQRREELMQRKVSEDDVLLSHFIALGYFNFEGSTNIDIKLNFPPNLIEKKNEEALSRILSRYVGYLSRDGRRVRTINRVPLYSSFDDSLEERLVGIFGNRAEVVESVLHAVQDEVSRLQKMTTTSMAGLHGGLVGKYRTVDETPVVFKVETDFLAAYKSTRVPFLIHHYASENQLAARLVRRIPKPLTALPLRQGAYWISLAEDFSGRIVSANKDDLMIMKPELQRGFDYTIVEALYLAALYQEVMEHIHEKQPDTLLSIESSIPSTLSEEEIRSRLQQRAAAYEKIKPVVGPLLAGVHYRNQYLEYLSSGETHFVHGDFKSVHRRHGLILDTGSSRQDTVAVDLGRIFMDQPAAFLSAATFTSYLDSFVRMRERLNPTYEHPALLATTTLLQTMNDALRNLGWEIQQGDYHQIENYLSVLQKLDAMIQF